MGEKKHATCFKEKRKVKSETHRQKANPGRHSVIRWGEHTSVVGGFTCPTYHPPILVPKPRALGSETASGGQHPLLHAPTGPPVPRWLLPTSCSLGQGWGRV